MGSTVPGYMRGCVYRYRCIVLSGGVSFVFGLNVNGVRVGSGISGHPLMGGFVRRLRVVCLIHLRLAVCSGINASQCCMASVR